MIAAVIECPTGYVCNIYPAWGASEWLGFMGGFALIIAVIVFLVWLATR